MNRSNERAKGFSLIEVLLSVAMFGLIITTIVGGLIYGQDSTALSGSRARAVSIAEEGLEAVRNMRDASFSNLVDGTYGLAVTGNQWVFAGTSDAVDSFFTRQITVSAAGTNRKQLTSTVTWQQNAQRTGNVSVVSYMTNWKVTVTPTPTPTITLSATPTIVVNSCATYCQSLSTYSTGTCRQNITKCSKSDQMYQSGGDTYCTGGSNADTCCCTPL
ncbi:hypothetical protein BH09PAT2_BH09PAT2_11520 [soil metagenome]